MLAANQYYSVGSKAEDCPAQSHSTCAQDLSHSNDASVKSQGLVVELTVTQNTSMICGDFYSLGPSLQPSGTFSEVLIQSGDFSCI